VVKAKVKVKVMVRVKVKAKVKVMVMVRVKVRVMVMVRVKVRVMVMVRVKVGGKMTNDQQIAHLRKALETIRNYARCTKIDKAHLITMCDNYLAGKSYCVDAKAWNTRHTGKDEG